jgi:hypothetical protein
MKLSICEICGKSRESKNSFYGNTRRLKNQAGEIKGNPGGVVEFVGGIVVVEINRRV